MSLLYVWLEQFAFADYVIVLDLLLTTLNSMCKLAFITLFKIDQTYAHTHKRMISPILL